MLICLDPFGRLGNRLFLSAHLIAFSCKNQIPLWNPSFGEYASFFPWLEGNAGMAYPWRETGSVQEAKRDRLFQLVREHLPWSRRYRHWKPEAYDFDRHDDPRLMEPLRAGYDVFFRGWLFRGPESVKTYRPQILEVFRFSETVERWADEQIAALKAPVDWLVGVHVRWEDYRGTEHFLDQQAFRLRMTQAQAFWPNRKVGFLLFSNETIGKTGWGLASVELSPGKTVPEDLALMSRCDALMGPPSTFSGWACPTRTLQAFARLKTRTKR